jgi:hypothetical protein
VKCSHGGCQTEATHSITAAYPADAEYIHPLFATYPMPMARACRTHLAVLMEMDSAHPGATPAYLVRVIG